MIFKANDRSPPPAIPRPWCPRQVLLLLWGTAAAWLPGCGALAETPFEDVRVGLDFTHQSGRDGHYYFPEVMGAGAALFDADGDGDLDAYLVQGGPLGQAREGAEPPSDQFFWNRLESGTLRFEAADGFAGATEYGMGVATGDVDGDGDVDLFLANFGPNQLWRNRGDGTFEDVTARAGVGDPRWSVSAAFFDYDLDGDLDLYVANYVVISLKARVICKEPSGAISYCGPQNFTAERDQLLRNRGDGTFEDVSATVLGEARITRRGAGLGVVSGDFDRDGRPDLYVANDLGPNHLWIHGEKGRLADDGVFSGVALSGNGEAEASMGLAAADLDGDLDLDLFSTHLDRQTHTLYRYEGDGFFVDAGPASGFESASWSVTGFGTAVLDADADGLLDLYVTNGRVTEDPDRRARGQAYALGEKDQLFRGLGNGRFEEIPAVADDPAWTGRGVAAGDVDNDGDVDLLVSHHHGPARLLLGRASSRGPWIGLEPLHANGKTSSPAEIYVDRKGAPTLLRRAGTDGSYASASDPRVVVALGKEPVTAIRVRWPDGTVETFPPTPPGRYSPLPRGRGIRAGGEDSP